MTYALIIVLCAILNRLRGDDRWKGPLPGRALFYVAPAVGLAAWLPLPWPAAAAFAVAYLFWGIWPWGRWFDLERMPDDFGRESVRPSAFECVIAELSFGSEHGAMFLRHLMALPGFWLVGMTAGNEHIAWLAFPFAVLAVAAYEAGWRIWPKYPIPAAEIIVGALWGASIAALAIAVQA